MKKNIVYLLLAALMILPFGCSDEAAIGPDNSGPGTLPEGHAAVQFSFSGIGGTARSYSEVAPRPDSLDCAIDSVMIYVFNDDLDNDGISDGTPEPAANAQLENIAKVRVGATAANAADQFLAQATFINSGPKWFVVVANGKDTATISEGMLYSDFIQQCSPAADVLPVAPFYMSGMATGMLNSNSPANVTIELTRLVTRIDITIRNSAGVGATNPFVLEQVRIANVNSKGFLMWNPDGSSFFEPTGVRFTTSWMDVSNGEVLTSATSDSLWHYLYTYETLAETGNQVALEIKGTYRGQPSEYRIPLTRDEDNVIVPNIPLRNLVRNHRYLVYIDSMTYTDLESEVIVTDWDFTDRDTIPYEPGISFGSPVATIQNVGSYNITPGVLIGNFTVDTFSVDASGISTLVVDLESYNIRSEFYSNADWITAVETSAYSNVGSDTVAIRQQFTVTVDAVATGFREGYFEFRNPIMKGNKKGYAVVQTAPVLGAAPVADAGMTITGNTIALSSYTTSGSESFQVSDDAVIDIPAAAAGWLSLSQSYSNTTGYTITVARNDSYAAKSAVVTISYPGTDTEKINYTFTQPAAPVTITASGLVSTTGTVSGTTVNNIDGAEATLTFRITESFEESGYTSNQSWLTLASKTTVTEPAGTNQRVTDYTFTVAGNGTGLARSGTVTFSNGGSGSAVITVNQLDYAFLGTPLAKFAPGNLAVTGSAEWTPLTAELAVLNNEAPLLGGIYQWGRRKIFAAAISAAPATTAATVAFANGASNSNWITINPWHSETGTAADTWTQLSGGAVQNNDPCPSGWHVPTQTEFRALTNDTWLNTDTFSVGRYQIIGNYAVRWKWLGGAMEVKMAPTAVNGITAGNVIGHAIWNNSRTETRYFPAAGRRATSNGTIGHFPTSGFYWTTTAANANNAYYFVFNGTEAGVERYWYRSEGYSIRCVQN